MIICSPQCFNETIGLKIFTDILQTTIFSAFSWKKIFVKVCCGEQTSSSYKNTPFCLSVCLSVCLSHLLTPSPFGLEGYCRHGSGGRAGSCQICGTHICVTAWRIFSIRSSVELSRPVVVHCYGHLPICPIWACPWAKNLSNLPQIGSRLCGTHISEIAGWIYPI